MRKLPRRLIPGTAEHGKDQKELESLKRDSKNKSRDEYMKIFKGEKCLKNT